MTSGTRRQGTLLLLIALAAGIGIGVGEWRRRHPDLVERLERFDHVDPGPLVATPFRLRPGARGQLARENAYLGDKDPHQDDGLNDRRDVGMSTLWRPPRGAEAGPGLAARAPAPSKATRAPVDLNRASADALAELPGVGPGLARTIVAARESRGPFVSVDDLRWIRGIGPARLERLRPFVTVSP